MRAMGPWSDAGGRRRACGVQRRARCDGDPHPPCPRPYPRSDNAIGPEGSTALAPHLEKLAALHTLDIRCAQKGSFSPGLSPLAWPGPPAPFLSEPQGRCLPVEADVACGLKKV